MELDGGAQTIRKFRKGGRNRKVFRNSTQTNKQTNDNGKTFPGTLQVLSRKTKYIKTEQQ